MTVMSFLGNNALYLVNSVSFFHEKHFFDLDGTLLPMVQDDFVRCYYKLLTTKMSKYGVEPKKLIDALNYGAYQMTNNDGTMTNEERFWIS